MLLPTSLSKLQMASPNLIPPASLSSTTIFHKTRKNELKWNQIEIFGAVFSGSEFPPVVIFKAAILI